MNPSTPSPSARRLLGYCSNVHPFRGCRTLRQDLAATLPHLRGALGTRAQPALGLWLPEAALSECEAEGPSPLRDLLEDHGVALLGANAFPLGRFHGGPVKHDVYRPDWQDPHRAEYTLRVARLLAGWLAPGAERSLTTVPLGWRSDLDGAALSLARRNLIGVLQQLASLADRTGRVLRLALEPEPGCQLERGGDAPRVWEALRIPPDLRPYLGLCLDVCHLAVLFEDPAATLRALQDAEIPVLRVQASAALRCRGDRIERLGAFDDGVYLHQSVLRRPGQPDRAFDDLPELLAEGPQAPDAELRCHVHVPVFLEAIDEELGTTQAQLAETLTLLPPEVPVEVETYTWSVLPPALRAEPLGVSIAREVGWTAAALQAAPRPVTP